MVVDGVLVDEAVEFVTVVVSGDGVKSVDVML